LKTDHP